MRVRVKFRYRPETGEVELYEVEDIGRGPRAADHDARHDHAAVDLARLVEDNAEIEEIHGAGPPRLREDPPTAGDESASEQTVRRDRRRT